MRKDEVTQGAVMQVVLHGQRYQVDDFGRIDAKQGTAYYAPRMRVDDGFHHTVYVLQCTGARYGGSRQPGHLERITAFHGFFFGQADMRQRRVCKIT